jgi:hypothetical protein
MKYIVNCRQLGDKYRGETIELSAKNDKTKILLSRGRIIPVPKEDNLTKETNEVKHGPDHRSDELERLQN